jgi:MinD-like ATPase involved in chromosome partitioning or flagellar assembly
VVNCVRTSRTAQSVFAKLQALSPMAVRLSLRANIPDDQNLRRAAMLGRPLVDLAPTSPASRAFERLHRQLLASPPRRPSGGAWLVEAQL